MRLSVPPLSPRIVAASIIGAGGLISAVVTFPGSMEDDSYVQLVEGREGFYSGWHPPIMSWMLGISDAISPGAGAFVLFQELMAFVALVSLFWLPRRVSWAAVAAAAIVVCLPQFFIFQAIVWKDALFADAALAGFVCLAHAAVRWQRPRLRIAMIAGATVFLALAVLARQNGFVILPCAIVALAIIAALQEEDWRTGLAYGTALLFGSIAVVLLASAALSLRSDGSPSRTEQIKILQMYDITGMVKADPGIDLPVLEKSALNFARIIRSDGVGLFSPIKNDTLEYDAALVAALHHTPASVLGHQWRSLIISHPGAYLALRAQLFRWVFFPPDVGLCHPYHVGNEGDAEDLKDLGVTTRMDRRDVALREYGKVFIGTPVFAHPTYALIAIAALVFLLRRRRPEDWAFVGLLAGALLFSLSFFVISIACDYRYLFLLDLSALAAVLYVLADSTKQRV